MSEAQTGGPDATMDGRTPILPEPTKAPEGVDQAKFDAALDKGVEARMSSVTKRYEADAAKAAETAEKTRVLSSLQTYIDGNPGDDGNAAQFRSAVQDMVIAIHSGDMGERKPADFLTDAAKLSQARMQVIQAAGGDGSDVLPVVRRANTETDGRFDIGVFMGSLGNQLREQGEKFSGDSMTGAPELEFAVEQMEKSKYARDAFAELSGDAGPRQRVVPVPMSALRPDVAFAQTYGTDAANLRQPDYRRDALVPWFRPINVLGDLGVPMPMIANDITLPRLTTSIEAAWYTETANIAESLIAVTPITTSPKRLGVLDDISWMLLASGDAQFGVVPVVVSEMAAAMMQAKESAVYGGAITSGPTGIRGTTNIKTKAIGTTDITYLDMLNMITVLANDHLPVQMGRFLINPTIREELSVTRKYASGADSILNDDAWRAPGSGPGDSGMFSSMVGTIAGQPCMITTHIPVATGGDTYIYFALWQYVWCVDYSVAFLTINDISLASSGQTRITVNSFHDVAVRFPASFNVATVDTI